MRKVVPYQTFRGLERALDIGGRWFDVLSRAGDGRVSRGELQRAAGSVGGGRAATGVLVLFRRPRRSPVPEGRVRLGAVRSTLHTLGDQQLLYLAPRFYSPLDGGEPAPDEAEGGGHLVDALKHRVS